MPEFWISRVTQGLPIFVNLTGFWIYTRTQLRKGSKYSRIPNMPDFCICKHYTRFRICLNMSEYGWIMPEKTVLNFLTAAGFCICLVKVSQGFEYASGSEYVRARNMTMLWICKGYKGWGIRLNKPEYALTIPQYAWICLHSAEYLWIYLDIPE